MNFAVAATVPTGPFPFKVATADFNGDAKRDFAVTYPDGGNVGVFLGNGDGTFRTPQTFAAGTSGPNVIVAGDLTGDGNADLLVAGNGQAVELLPGLGDGTFGAANTIALDQFVRSVGLGDFNGDGKLDIAIISVAAGEVVLSNGNGTFQGPQPFAVPGSDCNSLTVGDFNLDGKLDVVTTSLFGTGSIDNLYRAVTVAFGNGDGTLGAAATFAAGKKPLEVIAGDFNGDGAVDVAAAADTFTYGQVPTTVSLLLGNANGTFQAPRTFGAGAYPSSLAVADFNGDGRMDLAVGNRTPGNGQSADGIYVLLGNVAGTFDPIRKYAVHFTSHSVAVGDFNGNGTADIVATSSDGSANVLLGNGDGTFSAVALFDADPNQTFNTSHSSLALADFNHDGRRDIATAFFTGFNELSVLLNEGNDLFQARTFAVGTQPYAVATGDFSGEGNLDVVTANYGGGSMSLLLGNGDGTFAPQVTFAAGTKPSALAVGDFNGDAKLDVAVANYAPNGTVTLFLGNGNGTFQTGTSLASGGPWLTSVAAADFNHDNKLDLVLTNSAVTGGTSNVALLLGNGDGSFKPAATFAADFNPGSVAVADFNNDGNLDVATETFVHISGHTLATLLGHGDGTLGAPVVLSNAAFRGLAAGDVNGDGNQDVVVTSFTNDSTLTAFLGNGSNTFAATTFAVGSLPDAVALGDLTGDGTVDVATDNLRAGGVSVMQNTGPAVTGFSPGFGPVGSTVTVTGRDFVGVAAVAFNGVATGNFTVNSPTSITVVVPPGATSGPVAVAAVDGIAKSVANFTVTPPPFLAGASTGGAGQFPTGVAVGDFNGDGRLDTAAANYGPSGGNSVSVLFGDGGGGFAGAPLTLPLPPGTNPFGIAAGRFLDGSNALSIVTGNFGGQSVAVLRGNGDGTFQPPLLLPAMDAAGGLHKVVQVAVGDLNGDGRPDIAAASGDGTYTVFLGHGDGTFQALPTRSALTPLFGIAIAAVDTGAGPKPSLIAAAFAAWRVAVLPGNGDGTFAAPLFSAAVGGRTDEFLAAGDFNRDGQADVAVSNKDSATVAVLLGRGDGTFGPAATYAVGSTPLGIVAGDVTGDGQLDLVIADLGSDAVSVLVGNGDGTFQADRPYAAGPYPIAVAVGAFAGGGGAAGVVAASFFGRPHDAVTVAANRWPTVTGFAPGAGAAGAEVVVFGTNFVDVLAVAFNGKATGAFVVNSATQLTVAVPAGAGTGPVGVATGLGVGVSAAPFTVT